MLFNSFDFVVFFPIVVLLYYVLKHQYRVYLLLLASYFFYFYWEPSLVLLLFASTVIDYFCGIKIYDAKPQRKKHFLWLSIFVNLGLLFFFKYFGFFTQTSMDLLRFFGVEHGAQLNVHSYNIQKILLPVGISFYTFQTMSYSIDVYRGTIEPERNFAKYALYVSFFPQLVAGPIERANRLIPQFYKNIQINIPNIRQGIIMMAWGYFLKIVVADRLGIYVDQVFLTPENYPGTPLILGVIFFAFQLYFDFSAYTTIAIGAAKILGINLMQNFNRPMYSQNLKEFWNRWHISLMHWLRDYLYKPLKQRKLPRGIALIIVYFFVGFWHGADWTFIIWGLLNGCFLIIEIATDKFRSRYTKKSKLLKKLSKILWYLIPVPLTIMSLVFFRAPSIDNALNYLNSLFEIKGLGINILPYSLELYITIALLIFVQIIHYFKGNDKIYELITKRPQVVRWLLYIIFIIVIVFMSVNRQNHFIYFQF